MTDHRSLYKGAVLAFLFIALPSMVANGQSNQLLSLQARSCSFTDETVGYSAVWHSNCTGFVTFVINFRNFPMGNYWIGIGFELLSTEMALIEVVNGYATVQLAKLFPNQPPQRDSMNGFLVNPRATFFGSSLEATFAIDQTLLEGCKEWKFYTMPTRLSAPYVGQPFSKTVCNVGETCSRYPCFQDSNNRHLYDPSNGYGNGYFRPDSYITQQPYGTMANRYGAMPPTQQQSQYGNYRNAPSYGPQQYNMGGYQQSPYSQHQSGPVELNNRYGYSLRGREYGDVNGQPQIYYRNSNSPYKL